MAGELRKPFFFIALGLLVLAFLTETGSLLFRVAGTPPGLGIPYLAFIDGLLLYTVILVALATFVPARVHGLYQGIATFLVALGVTIGGIVAIVAAVGLLMLMLSLLLAVPFGTIAYMAKFADFETATAASLLGFATLCKLGFAGFLIAAHQRFLQNKGLVLLTLTALLGAVIVSFLQGLPPGFLVSITDAIAAIVAGVLAVIWAIVLLIGSVPSVIKAFRVDRMA